MSSLSTVCIACLRVWCEEDVNIAMATTHCRRRYTAIVAYSMDTGKGASNNIYYSLNNALRNRKSDAGPFQLWQPFLFFLMRALDQLPKYSSTRAPCSAGVTRATTTPGCPIQWAACSRY